MDYKPLSDYGIIGNTRTAALIASNGSCDWLCIPRFDSASIFASILDWQKGGYFQIKPAEKFKSKHRYLPNTNVLETQFETNRGKAKLVDFMPVFRENNGQFKAEDQFCRQIRVITGEVEMEVIFAPALNYAKGKTELFKNQKGIVAKNNQLEILLAGSQEFTVESNQTYLKFKLKAGQSANFSLIWDKALQFQIKEQERKLTKTIKYWQNLCQKITYQGSWKKEVIRSFLILHLLAYSPTGAIVAAATTSLPEKIGGSRNWDYRFSWLRDSAFSLRALFSIGDVEEALEYFSFLTSLCAECGPDVDIMYGIDKKSVLKEKELTHFSGYQNSKPVRVGNAAAVQLQIDVFGELLDAAFIFLEKGGQLEEKHWKLFESLVDAVCLVWNKADHGFWEVRSQPKHFVSSKVFSWVAVDRGIKIAKLLGYSTEKIPKWQKVKKEIKNQILKRGWNPKVGSFTQHYQTPALDSTTLLMPIVGFLPANHPKMLATLNKIAANLTRNNFLARYDTQKTDDGINETEGAFLAVNFWFVQNLILLGEIKDAEIFFKRLLKTASPLGLFSEMIDPVTGEMLGNLPQALTHLEVVITAVILDKVKERV